MGVRSLPHASRRNADPRPRYVSAVSAQENFRLLGEKEIRARVIGKDITDASHWATYLRSDGVLMRNEIDHKWTGVWKIRNNKLCMSNPSSKSLNCNEVWMSGENIRLRQHKEEETFDAVVANAVPCAPAMSTAQMAGRKCSTRSWRVTEARSRASIFGPMPASQTQRSTSASKPNGSN